jgi:hypothetical protein
VNSSSSSNLPNTGAETSIVIATMEAVQIEGMEPGRIESGAMIQAIEFFRAEDPKLKMNRKLAIFQEWQRT